MYQRTWPHLAVWRWAFGDGDLAEGRLTLRQWEGVWAPAELRSFVDEKGLVSLGCHHPQRQWVHSSPGQWLLTMFAIRFTRAVMVGRNFYKNIHARHPPQTFEVGRGNWRSLQRSACRRVTWKQQSEFWASSLPQSEGSLGFDMAGGLEFGTSQCSFRWDVRSPGGWTSQQMPSRREDTGLGGFPQGPRRACIQTVSSRQGCTLCLPPPLIRGSK